MTQIVDVRATCVWLGWEAGVLVLALRDNGRNPSIDEDGVMPRREVTLVMPLVGVLCTAAIEME